MLPTEGIERGKKREEKEKLFNRVRSFLPATSGDGRKMAMKKNHMLIRCIVLLHTELPLPLAALIASQSV